MLSNPSEIEAHSLKRALSLFEENRKQLIRYLLNLDSECWRHRLDQKTWSVSQIVEHINSVENSWWISYKFSKILFRFLPVRPKLTITVHTSPFNGKKFKKLWWFPSPKGNSRRKHYFSKLDSSTQRICYSIENLDLRLSGRLRFYSPLAGVVGIVDAVLLLYYHDNHHFQQIQSIVHEIVTRQNGKSII